MFEAELLEFRRQSLQEAVPDSEVEFQEQLIQEREGEIAEIEQGITELNQIFRDLASIVTDQGSMISTFASRSRAIKFNVGCKQKLIKVFLIMAPKITLNQTSFQ
jgi:t-SNARE complex subunit (syntaxin)